MRVHTYVIATDAGSAPNYDPPLVTLAVCKPRIRRKAKIGDLVLAFAGKSVNPTEPHTVIWAGVVKEKMTFFEYWENKRFDCKKPDGSDRPDNFYRPSGGGLLWVQNPTHGPEEAEHDIRGQYVLAFKPTWQFGAQGPVLPFDFGLRMVSGRRGERVTDLSEEEWCRLFAWLNEQLQIPRPAAVDRSSCRPKQPKHKVATVVPRRSHC